MSISLVVGPRDEVRLNDGDKNAAGRFEGSLRPAIRRDRQQAVPETGGPDRRDLPGERPRLAQDLVDHPDGNLHQRVGIALDPTVGGQREAHRRLCQHLRDGDPVAVEEHRPRRRRADVERQHQRRLEAAHPPTTHRPLRAPIRIKKAQSSIWRGPHPRPAAGRRGRG